MFSKSSSSTYSNADLITLRLLKQKQFSNFPRIKQELLQQKRKTGHYIWWLMPTTKPGAAEPGQATYVNPKSMHLLFEQEENSDSEKQIESTDQFQQRIGLWKEILEMITEWQVERVPVKGYEESDRINNNQNENNVQDSSTGRKTDVSKNLKDKLKQTLNPFGKNSNSKSSTNNRNKPKATSAVLPTIDHGRVHFFIELWSNKNGDKNVREDKIPIWIKNVCAKLDRYDWGYG